MIRKSTLLFALFLPTSAHACFLVPSFWSRLVVPGVWLAVASVFLFFSIRICFKYPGLWWKVPIVFVFLLVGYWIRRLYYEFNFNGAVNCGLPFKMVAFEILVISMLIWVLALATKKVQNSIDRKPN